MAPAASASTANNRSAGNLWIGPFSSSFEDSFLKTIQTARAADPLSPIVILVGSNLLAAHLRHALARTGAGHANVRFLTFVDLAGDLLFSAELSSGRRSFPSRGEELLLADLACNIPTGHRFGDVATQTGFHKALRTTFHDLIDGGVTRLPGERGKIADVAELFESHRRRYLPSFLTTADRIFEASDHAKAFPQIFGTDTLFLYGIYDLTHVQRNLLQACGAVCRLNVWMPVTEAPPLFVEETRLFFEGLGLSVRAVAGKSSAEIHFLSAPGNQAEAEETVRWILKTVEEEKLALHRVGILLRDVETYRALFADVLDRASVPFYLEGGVPLSSKPLGKAFLILLDTLEGGWDRDLWIHFFSLFPWKKELLHDAGEPADWDSWSREARATKGIESTLIRFSRYLASLESKQHSHAPLLRRFLTFLRAWFSDVTRLTAGVRYFLDAANVLSEFVRRYAEDSPEQEKLLDICESLKDLDDVGVTLTFPRLFQILRDRTHSAGIQGEIFEKDGLFVGSMVSARGISFDLVCIPGLVERAFPAPARPDPLLLDHERKRINELTGARLGLKENRLDEERAYFEFALLQADRKVFVSYPRLDPARGSELLPSSFYLETRNRLRSQADERILRSPLLRWNAAAPEPFLDEIDWLSSEAAQKILADPAGMNGALADWSPFAPSVQRWVANRLGSKQWSEHDGIVGPTRTVPSQTKAFSPSEISTYAICPYRYFLRYVLRLRRLERPEDVDRIRPLDRGDLIHRILYLLFSELRREGRLPLRATDRPAVEARLQEIAEGVLDDAEIRLPVGYASLWAMERKTLLSDLQALVAEEFREDAFTPEDFEIRFGMPARSDDEGLLSTDRPLHLRFGRDEIDLCGRIDRLDLSPDRKRARIIDYKTGQLDAGDDQFGGGESIQLPVYLSALALLTPDVSIDASEALLLSTLYGSGFERVHFSGAALQARQEEFHQILATFRRNVSQGIFPPKPGAQNQNCKRCDYSSICGRGIGRVYERKADDPLGSNLRAMEEIP